MRMTTMQAASLFAGCLWLAAHSWGAELPNLERGRMLYDNHCIACHTSKVHRRIPPLPIDVKELRQIVAAWAKGEQLNWSDEDVTDVVEYLDRTYYRFLREK